jgi:hypothetical protein
MTNSIDTYFKNGYQALQTADCEVSECSGDAYALFISLEKEFSITCKPHFHDHRIENEYDEVYTLDDDESTA